MELLHMAARTSVEWMLYCLLEGTLLALFAWVLLRLLPRQNAGTRFALWFSVLLATIVLPFAAGTFFRASATRGMLPPIGGSRGLMTLSDSLAIGIFIVWAVLATMALLRVMVGLWQVHRIRRNSETVDPEMFGAEVKACLESFPREVTLRTSDQVQVPAAIGFLTPAVVIPRWFQEEMSSAELQQVVLHELTHLRRRDDWTNLAQKIIKALLFFHPFVWWLEQRLSLEREMACDDAVLAQSASPQRYAECLARLAEKTLTRRKISLAQAVVGRVRQLSLRIAQILDKKRPSSTRIWKPAVPMVMAGAALCGFSAWIAPTLVSFQEVAPATVLVRTPSAPTGQAGSSWDLSQPKLILASASSDHAAPQPVVSKTTKSNNRFLGRHGGLQTTKNLTSRSVTPGLAKDSNGGYVALAMNTMNTRAFYPRQAGAKAADDEAQKAPPSLPAGDYVYQSEQVVLTMSATGQPQVWQVRLVQVVSIVPPADPQTQNKTVTRKKI